MQVVKNFLNVTSYRHLLQHVNTYMNTEHLDLLRVA